MIVSTNPSISLLLRPSDTPTHRSPETVKLGVVLSVAPDSTFALPPLAKGRWGDLVLAVGLILIIFLILVVVVGASRPGVVCLDGHGLLAARRGVRERSRWPFG